MEMKGAKGDATSQKGKRSKSGEYVNNVHHGFPSEGLNVKRSNSGSASSQAALGKKGSKKK